MWISFAPSGLSRSGSASWMCPMWPSTHGLTVSASGRWSLSGTHLGAMSSPHRAGVRRTRTSENTASWLRDAGYAEQYDVSMLDGDRPLLTELAEFACAIQMSQVPASVVEHAKLTFQHNLLVALAARRERLPGQDWEEWPAGLPRAGSATRLTTGRQAPAERAVVTNALAMGARAQHDEYPPAISHFGS